MTSDAPGEDRLMIVRQIRDIRVGPDHSIDIVANDQDGTGIVIRVGPDDLLLISKALKNRYWKS